MFGFKKKNTITTVQETPYMSVSDEKLDAIKAILVTVGLDEEDHNGFTYQAKKKSSYSGGSFEWTIPEQGVRFWVYGWGETGLITKVKVSDHNGWTRFTLAQFDEANRKLAELFA